MKPRGKKTLSPKDLESIEEIRSGWSEQDVERVVADTSTRLPRNWKQIREAILSGLLSECSVCGSTTAIQIHHRDGNEANNDHGNLMPLCNLCHDKLPCPPFSEELYCQVILHDGRARCLRGMGWNDAATCELFSAKHGCLLRIFDATRTARKKRKRPQVEIENG